MFANQASHHVDLVQWCLGQPVTVYATGRTALAKDIETEDTGGDDGGAGERWEDEAAQPSNSTR